MRYTAMAFTSRSRPLSVRTVSSWSVKIRSFVRSQLRGRLYAAQFAMPSTVTTASAETVVSSPNCSARPLKKRFSPPASPNANPATMPARPSAAFAMTNCAFPKKRVTTVETRTTRPIPPITRAKRLRFRMVSGPAMPLDGAVGQPEPEHHEGEVVDDVLQLDPALQERHEVLGGAEPGGEIPGRPLGADREDGDHPQPEQHDERDERRDDHGLGERRDEEPHRHAHRAEQEE